MSVFGTHDDALVEGLNSYGCVEVK